MLSLFGENMYERLRSKHGGQRKKLLWFCGCSITLLVVLIGTISGLTIKLGAKTTSSSFHNSPVSRAIVSACKDALYRESCESSLLSIAKAPPKSSGELFDLSVQFAMGRAHSARSLAYNLSLMNQKPGTHLVTGMDDCVELLDETLGQLNNVLDHKKRSPDDILTWLSAALTNQRTCREGLQGYGYSAEKDMMDAKAHNLSQFISNSLALYKSENKQNKESTNSNFGGRRLLSDGFPTWVSARERKLLETSIKDIGAKAVVAQDGTGTHNTIAEALASVSLQGDGEGGRTVIHVKAGTYNENLKIPASQKNVMLVGDGKGQTVIVGSKNYQQGLTTFRTATFAATGDGFMARDITFVNSAGPAKHQAVALLVGSDKSVIYRCSIIGYQDTLYTYANRQFYRETDIYGTVDFIFGNSAVVFQNCNIYVRKPMSGQQNYVTAQGRADPNQNTGISIHNCKIVANSDLASSKGQFPTYLGRPWHEYSRTIVMESFLDDIIHPSGWGAWSGSFALKTLYYGEYKNSGPGASTSNRVKWPGYRSSLTATEASDFTVGNFIFGNIWLPSTGVPFDSGLGA